MVCGLWPNPEAGVGGGVGGDGEGAADAQEGSVSV